MPNDRSVRPTSQEPVPARILHGLSEVRPSRRVVGLGSFDGVHAGHRRVIERTVEAGASRGVPALVATFHPLPRSVVDPSRPVPILSSLATRIALIEDLGPSEILVLRFDAKLAAISAEAFAREILADGLGAEEVVVGANFRFGHARTGGAADLERLGSELGFAVSIVPLLELDGDRVSSTRIRGLIEAGEVKAAGRLLGRVPSIEGEVVRGDGRGRELGMPTANLAFAEGHVLPAEGVYAGYAVLDSGARRQPAAISVGWNETFGRTPTLRIESHLLDFDEDLYGAMMTVELVDRLRGQVRFDGVPALIEQMDVDLEETRRRLR